MKTIVVADWYAIEGEASFRRPGGSAMARIDLEIITEGCSVIVRQDSTRGCDDLLVGYFTGRHSLSFAVSGAFEVVIRGDRDDTLSSVRLPWSREGVVAGWTEAESMVQLEPKGPDAISPEVQKMMDTMQRNALIRESILRSELERKYGDK